MSNGARAVRGLLVATGAVALAFTTACSGSSSPSSSSSSGEKVTLEFAQWWEPELPDGALQGIMNDFQAANPNITVKLLSGPYASTKEQVVAGAASGTMSDVVGLDGAWVSDFAKQNAITDLTALMKDNGYDDSQLVSQVAIDGKTRMIPVINFVYPMFTNTDLLTQAGVSAPPSTRTEFMDAAKKVTALGNNTAGWVLPLSLDAPNGVQNDVMSWVWASGGSMLKDGKPDLTNKAVTSGTQFVKDLWDAGVVAQGSFTMKEQDKVEEFTNGRVGMMIDSLAHINLIKKENPALKFAISAIPAEDGYTGPRGIPYASWGIGIAENSKHKAEALKLVTYLMSKDVNSKLSTLANAFPGNKESKPDFSNSDPLFQQVFDIYKAGTPANEFVGLPVSEQLMRDYGEQLQLTLNGDESVSDALKNAQAKWVAEF
ncbi:MAG: sugar ABC transporter substrate-binding protein [Actinobacteria bacterium]|nr:sugar ABC transporter substrate-binding protein [Actinomycetota bacterium]